MYKLKYKIWLDQDGKAFGTGPMRLLLGIRKSGSLAAAAKELGMSYSQAHKMMKQLSARLGFALLRSKSGGAGGGGTEITAEAEDFLTMYQSFQQDCSRAIEELFYDYFLTNQELLQENSLVNAFGIGRQGIISFVGGGGKTSLIWRLAEELKAMGGKVLLTTTTHIMPPGESANYLLLNEDPEKLAAAVQKKLRPGQLAVAARGYAEEKLAGIPSEWVERLADFADYILIEADGARRLPFKAPAEHEPVIPKISSMVVTVLGIDVLGKALNEENVFRSELVSRLSGTPLGAEIDYKTAASVIVSDRGGRKGVPLGAHWVVCLNKADGLFELQNADMLAKYILAKRPFVPVLATSTIDEEIIKGRWQN